MKKWLLTLGLSIMMIGLVACGSTENAKDIYAEAMKAAGEMKSAEVAIEMKQEMTVPGEEKPMIMESKMDTSMIMDPVAMYQKGTTVINMPEMPEGTIDMEQEIYLVEDVIYMFDTMTNQWMKMDSSTFPMDMINNQQMDVTEQLEMLNDYVEDFNLDESGNQYILNLTLDGDGVLSLSEEMMKEFFPEDVATQLGVDMGDILNHVAMNKFEIEMKINKDTFHLSDYQLITEMTITENGEEITLSQNIQATYKGINTVEKIEVPQEVQDSAVDALDFLGDF